MPHAASLVVGPRRTGAFAGALGLFALAIALTLFRLFPSAGSGGLGIGADWAMIDFRSSVYYPAVAYLNGENPYDHVRFLAGYPSEAAFPVYPPAVLWLYAPFGLLGYESAAAAFYLFSVATTLLAAGIALRVSDLPRTATLVVAVAALMMLSRPGHMNLLVGQNTMTYVVGTYLAVFRPRSAPSLAGFGLALACLKPTFGIPLGLLMLFQKQFRAVAFGAGFVTLMNLPPLQSLIHAAGGVVPLARTIGANMAWWHSDPIVDPKGSLLLISASGVWSRLSGHALPLAGEVTLFLITFGAAAVALRALRGREDRGAVVLAASVVCLAMLTGVHHQPYDLLLLTLPGAALVGGCLPEPFQNPALRGTLLVLLFVLAFNYVATFSGVGALQLDGLPYRLVTSVNGIALVAMFVIVVGTVLLRHRDLALHH